MPAAEGGNLDFGNGVVLDIWCDLPGELEARVPQADPNYEPDAGFCRRLATAIHSDIPFYVTGPSGVGKTEGVRYLCAALHRPMVHVHCRGDMRLDDFVGTMTLVDSKSGQHNVTEYKYGQLPIAMKSGAILFLDELDAVPPHIAFVLHEALEQSSGLRRRLVLTRAGDEVIEAADGFAIVAAGNTRGRGDDTGTFVGTNIQNAALMDRFLMFERMTYPDADREVSILKNYGLEHGMASKLVRFAVEIRQSANRGNIRTPLSTRLLVAWVRLIPTLGVKQAMASAVLWRLDEDEAKFYQSIAQRELGLDFAS